MKEYQEIFKQRLSNDINPWMIYVYKLYIKNTFLHIITNEMIFYLSMLCLWMLYGIFR